MSGIMMSISTMLRSGVLFDDLDGLAAVGRADDLHVVIFEHGRQRKDVAGIVIDDQHLAAAQHFVATVQPLQHRLLLGRQIGHDAVQEQCRLIQQPLRAIARP